jgi:hypothetical protein
MVCYDYLCVPIFGLGRSTTRVLNELGAQGWELVSVWAIWHYFKRPKD